MENEKYICGKCGKEIEKESLEKLNINDVKIFCNECLIEKLDSGGWSLSQEREFIENLYVGRFNYFLVAFSLFVTAGFANSFLNHKYIVFYFGALLLFLCWMPLIRAYKKFNTIMKILFNHKSEHTVFLIQRIMENNGFKSKLVISRWIGVYIPIVCILFLVVIGILVQIKIIN